MPSNLKATEISWYKDTVNVDRICPQCGKPTSVHDIPREAFEDWWRDGQMNGPFIQQALFMLSADDAEILLSGIDSVCWDKIFPPDPEDDDEPEEYEPGPEVDDERGMSEFRYPEPDEEIDRRGM